MPHKLTCLRVRAVRVVSGSGAACEDLFVPCPMRGATRIGTCEGCMCMEMITADAKGAPDAVMCRPPLPLWVRLLERLRRLPETPVHQLVSNDLVCVTSDASPRQLADVMAERGLDAVAVVDYE